MGITSAGVSAQQGDWNQQVDATAASSYDGSFIKVGSKGRRNTAIAIGAIALGTILYNQKRKNNYKRREVYRRKFNCQAAGDWNFAYGLGECCWQSC